MFANHRLIKKFIFVFSLVLIFCSTPVEALTDSHLRVDSFLADGVFVVPSGVTQVIFEGWGGGGGGAGSGGSTTNANSGGGGGAYMKKTLSVTEGQTYVITVGQGGAAGSGDGGDSSVVLGGVTHLLAKGGKGGGEYGGAGGLASEGIGDFGYDGGSVAAAAGSLGKMSGGGAGDSGDASFGAPGDFFGGAGSNYPLKNKAYGSGGHGSNTLSSPGYQGLVRVSYFIEVQDFPVIKSRNWGRTDVNTTSHPINMPTGARAGDLLLILFSADGLGEHTIVPDSWNRLLTTNHGSLLTGSVFYKIAEGGDTATITTTNSGESVHLSFRIVGAGLPSGTSATSSGVNPDPPSHNVGVSGNYLWLAATMRDQGSFGTKGVTGFPANYNDFLYLSPKSNLAFGADLAVVNRHLESSSEDPGNFVAESTGQVLLTLAIPYQVPRLVSPSVGALSILEGFQDTYEIVLDRPPSNEVTVAFDYDSGNLLLDKDQLVFTVQTWDRPQIVTVTALNDNQNLGDRTSNIAFNVTSADSDYDGFVVNDLVVTIKDNQVPTVLITTPADGSSVNGVVQVSATTGDDLDIVGVKFKLNGEELGAEDLSRPFSVAWDTTGVPDGLYVLTAVVRDEGGGRATSAPVRVMVANQPKTKGVVFGYFPDQTAQLGIGVFQSPQISFNNLSSPALKLGTSGDEVRNLQIFLNNRGFLVSLSGPGSKGQETSYFGPATQAALARYQEARAIVTAKGYLDAFTRATIYLEGLSLLPSAGMNISTTTSRDFATPLSLGQTHSDVLALQRFLNREVDTRLAQVGVGSPGQETSFFGILTLEAVKRFQLKYGLAEPGQVGFGYVGPQTRAKLNELQRILEN